MKEQKHVTKGEIIAYFGVAIVMDIMNFPKVQDYWHKDMFSIPWFIQIFTVTRFDQWQILAFE